MGGSAEPVYVPLSGLAVAEPVLPSSQRIASDLARFLEEGFSILTAMGGVPGDRDPDALLKYVLDRLYSCCRDLLPYDRLGVALLDSEGARISAHWARSDATKPVLAAGYAARVAGSSIEPVLRNRTVRIFHDLQSYLAAHPDSDATRKIVAEGILSSMTCPLEAAGRAVGVMFFSSKQPGTYTREHAARFALVATHVSHVIGKCRLYQEALALDAAVSGDAPADTTLPVRERATTTQRLAAARVLCIDADPLSRRMVQSVLSDAGYDVVCHARTEDAAARVPDDAIDLLVIAPLPGRCRDGCVCAEARALPGAREAVVLVAVATGEHSGTGRCLSCPAADACLFRPLRGDELLARAETLLANRQLRRASRPNLTQGELLVGRYRILEPIAKGGYSTVYLAADTYDSRPSQLALKVHRVGSDRPTGKGHLHRFLREAYQLSKLEHPNVARLLDFGQIEGVYFLAMEYVDGTPFSELLSNSGPLSEHQLLSLGRQVASVLEYMRTRQLVHRDIKPANIMLTRGGAAKILDFGLARDLADDTWSDDQGFSGTPAFASPECLEGRNDIDTQADVYSLGVTLFHLASEQFPFAGATMQRIHEHQVSRAPRDLRRLNDSISRPFAVLVRRMLARRRTARPKPDALIREFDKLLAHTT